MSNEPEIINLDDNLGTNNSSMLGLDMLMNDKKKSNNNKENDVNINLDDINNLENELDELSGLNKKDDVNISLDNFNKNSSNTNSLNNTNFSSAPVIQSSYGETSNNNNTTSYSNSNNKVSFNTEPTISIPTSETPSLNTEPTISIPKSQPPSFNLPQINKNFNEEENDGYKKLDNVQIDENLIQKEKMMSKEEELKQKHIYLRKLENIERRGIKLTKKYAISDPLDEMIGEYEMHKSEKEKDNSIKFQGKVMTTVITALEYLNKKFDPFDIPLDGWSDAVTENLDDYEDIFGELHEKYKSKARMAPELKLLFQLGGSAMMVYMTNTMFKSAMPGMDDIMKQNPELMQQFTQAAVSSMSNTNPNFGNFMGDVMNGGGGGNNFSQTSNRQTPPSQTNRPDINMSRNIPRFDDSEHISDQYTNINEQSQKRPDMKGPSDINDLLSGIKTKKINMNNGEQKQNNLEKKTKGSTISIDELMSISKDADNFPKKSKRRQKSEKNTVSLDI